MSDDILKGRLVEQGYVPVACQANSRDIVMAVDSGWDPCASCDVDRKVCGGRPKRKAVAEQVAEGAGTPGRGAPNTYYFCGVDPAPALGNRSDDGAIAVAKAWPRVPGADVDFNSSQPSDWYFGYVGAHRLRKLKATQWSGKIHELHLRYGFTTVCMDPGGGGAFIQGEMRNQRQNILGVDRQTRPICTLADAVPEGDPILRMFKRGDFGIENLWPKLMGDDLLPDNMHTSYLDALETAGLVFPVPWSERPAEQRQEIERTWNPSDVWSLKNLSAGMKQLTQGRILTRDDGTWIVTKRNAKQFEWIGKKDIAYAMIYCYIGFRTWLKGGMLGEAGGDEDYAGEIGE